LKKKIRSGSDSKKSLSAKASNYRIKVEPDKSDPNRITLYLFGVECIFIRGRQRHISQKIPVRSYNPSKEVTTAMEKCAENYFNRYPLKTKQARFDI
jgi:hypothetical protein